MPLLPDNPEVWRIDHQLIRDGVVTLYARQRLFDADLAELRAIGYTVVMLDAAAFHDVTAFHGDIQEALGFPGYYGRNLDALNDCLSDVARFAYGADPASAGTVIAFRHFDTFMRREPDAARTILDIFTARARDGLLFGHWMLVLVQTDDPTMDPGRLGGQAAQWNRHEWLDASRSGADNS